jgi:hypothetical protein
VEIFAMKDKEKKLARRAANALLRLDRYRQRRATAAAKAVAEAAVADITRTARIAGWPEAEAEEAARRLLAAGVDPRRAACLFRDSLDRLQ